MPSVIVKSLRTSLFFFHKNIDINPSQSSELQTEFSANINIYLFSSLKKKKQLRQSEFFRIKQTVQVN